MFEYKGNNLNLIIEDKKVGYVLFDEKDDYIAGSYVYVDPNERGKGYAQKLIAEFVKFAEKKNKKILPICPVIKRNLETNYQYIIK